MEVKADAMYTATVSGYGETPESAMEALSGSLVATIQVEIFVDVPGFAKPIRIVRHVRNGKVSI